MIYVATHVPAWLGSCVHSRIRSNRMYVACHWVGFSIDVNGCLYRDRNIDLQVEKSDLSSRIANCPWMILEAYGRKSAEFFRNFNICTFRFISVLIFVLEKRKKKEKKMKDTFRRWLYYIEYITKILWFLLFRSIFNTTLIVNQLTFPSVLSDL